MTTPMKMPEPGRPLDRTAFEDFYAGKAPWDIGKPQKAFILAADRVASPVLDAGCGTGDVAMFFAARGLQVTAIDFVEEAIRRARVKAAERGLKIEFQTKDALKLDEWGERFASVIDSGLFHIFSDDDRRRYVRGLTHITQAGGRLFLLCFSDEEPGTQGPRRVSRQELHGAFAAGWEIESIEAVRLEVIPEFAPMVSEGGPKAWFAIIRRTG